MVDVDHWTLCLMLQFAQLSLILVIRAPQIYGSFVHFTAEICAEMKWESFNRLPDTRIATVPHPLTSMSCRKLD